MKLKLIIERSHFIKHTAYHWNVTLTFKMTSRQNIINTLYAEMCFFLPCSSGFNRFTQLYMPNN